MSESVIYCEGYHDRAFWTGWLRHLGCRDPGAPPPGATSRVPILDPWGAPVRGGQYAYYSQSNRFIRVVPCHGKSEVMRAARVRLTQRSTKALLRLVLNIDSDVTASGGGTSSTGVRLPDVLHLAQTFDSSAALNAEGEIDLDGGATKISLVRWEVPDPPVPGLPDQQTLERLVSAAQVAAYPARAAPVQNWLDGRPAPPTTSPKEHAGSYMVGWYAEHGCEAFYSNQWNDPLLVAELSSRLQSSGAWKIAATLAG